MQTLLALDLNAPSVAAPCRSAGDADRSELPVEGFASPLGFWLAPAERWATPPALRVEIDDSGIETRRTEAPSDGGRMHARILVPTRNRRGEASRTVTLEVDEHVARVAVAPDLWPDVHEAVLLAIAQHWRLGTLDRTLRALAESARRQVGGTGFARSREMLPWGGRRVYESRRRLHELLLDLPDAVGPLTNPRGYLGSETSLRVFRALAARLALPRRRELIDERVEVVEAVVDAQVESRRYSQGLVVQLALETLILVVLIGDFALHFIE